MVRATNTIQYNIYFSIYNNYTDGTYLTRYMSPCGLAIKKTQGGWEGHSWPLS